MRNLFYITGFVFMLTACSPVEQMPGGPGATGSGDGPNALNRIAWKVVSTSEIAVPPAIGSGGIAIVNAGGTLNVVEPEAGDELWSVETDGAILASPAWAGDKLIVGDDRGHVVRWDSPGGTEAWDVSLSGPVQGVSIEQGVVYAGTADGAVVALSLSDGKKLWEVRLGAPLTSRVTRSGDLLVFGAGDGAIHGVSAISGKSRWKLPCGQGAVRRIAVTDTIVVAGCDNKVLGANLEGKRKWKATVTTPVSAGMGVDSKHAYVGTEAGLLLALDLASGEEAWRHQAETFFWGMIAAGNGSVWAADHAGIIHAVGAADGQLLWSFKAESRTLGGVVASDGRLYFGDIDGNLYAIE